MKSSKRPQRISSEESLHCVLYARVSSAEQELGYSIPAQRQLLREYADKHNMVIEREFVEAETAKRAGRGEFEAMLAYLRTRRDCRYILVEKTDRLYRNLQDAAAVEALGVEVHFVKEATVLSPHSGASAKLTQGMKVLIAKHHVDNLSEEVKKGMRTKAEQGLWPSYAPLGYENTAGGDQKRIITPHPVLGPMAGQLFEWFATDEYSLKALSQRAFEEGFRFRRSQAKVPVSTLHKILRNPIYMGEFDFGGVRYQGIHEPLVTVEVWNRVQEILDRRGAKKHRRTTREFPYSGLVQCGHCGCSMVAEIKKGRYVYYHCTGYRGKCGEPYTPEAVLRCQFAAGLETLVIPPAMLRWLETELVDTDEAKRAALSQTVRRYQSELMRCQGRLNLLYEDRLDGRIDLETYDRKAEENREQEAQLRLKIDEVQAAAARDAADRVDLAMLVKEVGNLFRNQSEAEERKMLHVLLQEASWKAGVLQMSLREPFATLCNPR
jgi:DNA invertase Pin-like site-specific DNA recombinase